MKPWLHLLFSLILAAILYPIFNWKALFIVISGFLIDIDHYFWYVYKHRKFDLIKSYEFHLINAEKKNFEDYIGALLIFHSIEFLLVLVLLSFYTEFALILTIGLLLHHVLDLIWIYFVPKRFVINYSIISWIIKNKIQKA